MGRKKHSEQKEEAVVQQQPGEYSIGMESPMEAHVNEENVAPVGGKKKGKTKKGNSRRAQPKDDDGDEYRNMEEMEEKVSETKHVGKKPNCKKGGNNVGRELSFQLLENEETDREESVQTGEGSSNCLQRDVTRLFSASSFYTQGGVEEDRAESIVTEENEETDSISHSLNVSKLGDGSFDNLEHELKIAFLGKKKSSKRKSTASSGALEDEITSAVETKNSNSSPSDLVMDASAVESKWTDEVMEGLKNNKKNKKKKAGKTVQDEDDLDKLLADIGESPSISKAVQVPAAAPSQEDEVQSETQASAINEATATDKGEEEGVVESKAAKRRKKKKDKEKQKMVVAAATAEANEEKLEEPKNESKSKGADRKLSKHKREMLEALQRRKEAEERKKIQEEERLKKEEEDRRRQEELERLEDEAKRKKKEREKEKLLKKKQEGRLLTMKQKEERRRLEAMRNQFLASKGISACAWETGPPPKRPIYTSKNLKSRQSHVIDAENLEEEETKLESADDINYFKLMKLEGWDGTNSEKEASVASEKMDNHFEGQEDVEEDAEWDEKGWDGMDICLPVKCAFDVEAESEPAPSIKKEGNSIVQPANGDVLPSTGASDQVATEKSFSSHPIKAEASAGKQPHTEIVHTNKSSRKNLVAGKEIGNSGSQSKESDVELRSPICCVLGHVDTGKTKLLDCIRGTEVQKGEAGGITQQIGATYVPAVNIRERTKELKADAKLLVPGLLVIDTPGHESFTNLRSRGSDLCDIAILVVDIMHGLQPQTIESINLLKTRNTEFIVALNKVDRLYGWKKCPNAPFIKSIKEQSKQVVQLFNSKVQEIIGKFMEQGLNAALYYKNKEMGETFNIVPTSAISGEGIPDLLLLLAQWTQKTMVEKLTFSNKVQCTVLEVKDTIGYGTTIDVILVNGVLHEGDQIVVCGMQGPVVTTIRALLTPGPMKELRVKENYLHHKQIKAAQGIKIAAQGLDHATVGTLYVVEPGDDVERIKDLVMEDMQSIMSLVDKCREGVYVQASTLGSLEALLEFLKSPAVNIPVSGIGIGPVHKKDVKKASVMLEKEEYATILAFDVKMTSEAREYADEIGVQVFMADIIYHLFDRFKAYVDNLKEEKKKEADDEVVFPCVLQILPNCIFKKKGPILLGVKVVKGIVKVGTPICVPGRNLIDIGRITSIECNRKPVATATEGQEVAINIDGASPEGQQKIFGRHFGIEDKLVSHISRRSIDVLKAHYRDDLTSEDWQLVGDLKVLFNIS